MAITTQMRLDITDLYVAFFGRAPDGLSIDYWANGIDLGKSLSKIGEEMYAVPGVRAQYPSSLTPLEVITKFYTFSLGRAPEAGATDYWVAKLNLPETTEGTVIRDMIYAVKNYKAPATGTAAEMAFAKQAIASNDLFANRADVAYYYAMKGGDVAGTAKALDGVTNDLSTLATAKAAVDAYISAGSGQTFSLAVGADNLSPNSAVAASKTTAGDDLVRAVTANSLETNDSIDTGAGIDTLRANFTGTNTALTVKPLLNNLEKVFVNATLSNTGQFTLDLADATGVKELWNEGSTTTNNSSVRFDNVKLDTIVGVKDTTVRTDVIFAGATGATDAATIALADAGTAAATAQINVGAIEKLTINSTTGSVDAVTTNNVVVNAVQAETVAINGDQSLTLMLANNQFVTSVDASALTKALFLSFFTTQASTTAGVMIKAGVGADIINLFEPSAGAKVTVDLGAGADTLNISAIAFHKITLGDGADTVNLFTATSPKAIDVSSAARLAASVIEITDFKSGIDFLKITSGGTGTETILNGTQLAQIAASSSLLTAAQAAASLLNATNDGTTVTFQFGGDSYVLVDEQQTTANTLETGDVLIKLTGVTSTIAADVVVS
jgi:hypothetical protein